MSEAMVTFLLDQLDDPAVSARAMFGGHGIYRGGDMFAIVYSDDVYMKVSPAAERTSRREPFVPRPGQTLSSFRLVSGDEIDDPKALRELAAEAQNAAASRKRKP